jgi:hypothetical protein
VILFLHIFCRSVAVLLSPSVCACCLFCCCPTYISCPLFIVRYLTTHHLTSSHKLSKMLNKHFITLWFCSTLIGTVLSSSRIPGSDIREPTSYSLVKEGPYGSKLYTILCPGSDYESNPPLLLDLHGNSSYEQVNNHYLI